MKNTSTKDDDLKIGYLKEQIQSNACRTTGEKLSRFIPDRKP
jgi:hypothetical protein